MPHGQYNVSLDTFVERDRAIFLIRNIGNLRQDFRRRLLDHFDISDKLSGTEDGMLGSMALALGISDFAKKLKTEEDIEDIQTVIGAFSSTKLLPIVKDYGRLGAGFRDEWTEEELSRSGRGKSDKAEKPKYDA